MGEFVCGLCGDPMPAGEEMFKFHGYSGPCPKPPLPRRESWTDRFFAMSVADRIQTIVEDPSTLEAFIQEARLTQDWYRRWCLAREER